MFSWGFFILDSRVIPAYAAPVNIAAGTGHYRTISVAGERRRASKPRSSPANRPVGLNVASIVNPRAAEPHENLLGQPEPPLKFRGVKIHALLTPSNVVLHEGKTTPTGEWSFPVGIPSLSKP